MAKSYFGSANGRLCGEVAGNSFSLDGTTYALEPVGSKYTEGGKKGFYQVTLCCMNRIIFSCSCVRTTSINLLRKPIELLPVNVNAFTT